MSDNQQLFNTIRRELQSNNIQISDGDNLLAEFARFKAPKTLTEIRTHVNDLGRVIEFTQYMDETGIVDSEDT